MLRFFDILTDATFEYFNYIFTSVRNKKNFVISLLLAVFVVMLLCAPESGQLNETTSIAPNKKIPIKQENKLTHEVKLDPAIELHEIKDFQKELKEPALNQAKAVNAKAYFQLRKLQTLSEADLQEQTKMTPDERKSVAKSRVENALIAHLARQRLFR